MTDDYLDDDGYPTEATLERIREWSALDCMGLLEFAKALLRSNCYSTVLAGTDHYGDPVLRVSTGGWSGNEQVIYAMQDNVTWWAMHWYSSRRGGHHEFLIREKKP